MSAPPPLRQPSLPKDALRCHECFLPREHCLCAHVPTVKTRTHFLVVRHLKEIFKTSNTARLAVKALENSSMHTYGAPEAAFDESLLERPGTWLLYPEGDRELPAEPPRTLVVLDGSWHQTRRMTQRIAALRKLPKLSLPPPPAGSERLRRPPLEGGMSTIEAMAHALARLEGEALAAPLLALHDEQCRRILTLRGLLHPETGQRMFPDPVRPPARKQVGGIS